MIENVKTTCICEHGYDKGALKKTIENNIFTIYGNITKDSYIIIRYHGELIDTIDHKNYANNLYISYYFDGIKHETVKATLAKCTRCIGENYCVLIPLQEHNRISFSFHKECEKITDVQNTCYCNDFNIDITSNPLTDVLQKYGLEENNNLPAVQKSSVIEFKNIGNYIKNFFHSLFRKERDIA